MGRARSMLFKGTWGKHMLSFLHRGFRGRVGVQRQRYVTGMRGHACRESESDQRLAECDQDFGGRGAYAGPQGRWHGVLLRMHAMQRKRRIWTGIDAGGGYSIALSVDRTVLMAGAYHRAEYICLFPRVVLQ